MPSVKSSRTGGHELYESHGIQTRLRPSPDCEVAAVRVKLLALGGYTSLAFVKGSDQFEKVAAVGVQVSCGWITWGIHNGVRFSTHCRSVPL